LKLSIDQIAVQTLAAANDKRFFLLNPSRIYRARNYVPSEFGFDVAIALFANDETGRLGEVTIVIVKQYQGYRKRRPFSVGQPIRLDDDLKIASFLRSRGVNPDTMTSMAK
jgi:hypothetical protein